MADVAHDASGPASPRPDDTAQQQPSRPDSPDKGVFICLALGDVDGACRHVTIIATRRALSQS